ncbi:MAG: tRNA lysidine(34) synthetase TilS [Myxococcales bacterium]|nr:tRNA lysidine(34) synthetase TilS [Myxococcales bacterium]
MGANNVPVDSKLLDSFAGQFIVACSGGADSLALAHLAIERARAASLPMPVLAHIDHGLRPESKVEARAVAKFAESLGAPSLVRTVVVEQRGASLEAAARDARYEALDACAAQVGADWILLAHTRSDQAETVLMRIVRGTGLVGLAGMSERRGIYARPLLGLERAQTEEYCLKHGLSYSQDPMNREERYTRVRIRHTVLPQLRLENTRINEALCGLADSARDHREVLDWAASEVLQSFDDGAGRLRLGASFDALPQSLAARSLALFVEGQGGGPLERRHQRDVLALCRGASGGSRDLHLPGGTVSRRYDVLVWEPTAGQVYSVQAPEGFVSRLWQSGDRMRPERLKGRSRKLSDLFAEAKVPAAWRRQAWVVCCAEGEQAGEIVWAQHIGAAFGWQVPVMLVGTA